MSRGTRIAKRIVYCFELIVDDKSVSDKLVRDEIARKIMVSPTLTTRDINDMLAVALKGSNYAYSY